MTRELTPLASWQDALAAREPRGIDPVELGPVVVVAAHPDDETLAAGGLMQAVHDRGGEVRLVVATDGEAAHPELGDDARRELGRQRRTELHAAMRAAGLESVPVHWLGLPDSALDADELTTALRPLLRDAGTYLAPWEHDPHPDHAAAGRAAAAAAPVHVHGWGYPIWMWAWQRPDDTGIPWSHAAQYVLSGPESDRKRGAVARFVSQLRPGPDGGPPILPDEVLRYFDTGREVFFRAAPRHSAPRTRFDDLYAAGAGDPWDVRSSWYERRKRAVTLSCLTRERYRHAVEPGCGLGELTRELATRCDRVHASDYSTRAVAAARTATGGLTGVSVVEAALPDPDAFADGIDLAVVSEVLYYLGEDDVAATADRLAGALVPGGELLLVHWRGWPAEAPRDAAATHAQLTGDPRFETLVEHTDAEFLLHVLRRR